MKKFFLTFLALVLSVCLFACGTQSANAQVASKINKTISHMTNAIKEVETINENDILINNILPAEAVQTALSNPRRGVVSNRQIVNYNNQMPYGYSQTDAMKNVNTYNPYGRNHNVNSYAGYGETNPYAYNEIYQAQYGNGMYPNHANYPANPAYPNTIGNPAYGVGPNMYSNRGISNVNTYGLGVSNVDTYNPNAQNVQPQNTTTQPPTNSNLNTYKTNKSNDYNRYQQNADLQNQFTKLSSLYSVASSVVGVNRAIAYERDYILSSANTIKELADELKNKDVELSDSEKKSISNLLENIQTNVTKINLSKNEVKYEVEKVKSLKSSYNNLTEQLSSRYVRLTNCLETRYSFYCNISACLDQLKALLSFGNMPQNNQTNKINVAENNHFHNINRINNTANHSQTNNQNNVIGNNVVENNQNNNTVNNNQIIDNNQNNNKQNNVNNQTNNNQTNSNQIENAQSAQTLEQRLKQAFENAQKQQEQEKTNNAQMQPNQNINNENNVNDNNIVENNTIVENNLNNKVDNQVENQNNTQENVQNNVEQNNIENDNQQQNNENKVVPPTQENDLATQLEQQLEKQKQETKQPYQPLQTQKHTVAKTNKNQDTTQVENQPTRPKRPMILYGNNKNKTDNQTQQTSANPFKEPKKYDFLSFDCPQKKHIEPVKQQQTQSSFCPNCNPNCL